MTFTYKPISICRHGINKDNIGPIAKASFEETPEMFLSAAKHAELDIMKGVSANVLCGQEGYYGTSSFQIVLDIESMLESKARQPKFSSTEVSEEEEEEEEEGQEEKEETSKPCWEFNELLACVDSLNSNFMGDVSDGYKLGF
jgi:DNA-directed RNA polymerase II subunit RPB1